MRCPRVVEMSSCSPHWALLSLRLLSATAAVPAATGAAKRNMMSGLSNDPLCSSSLMFFVSMDYPDRGDQRWYLRRGVDEEAPTGDTDITAQGGVAVPIVAI